MNVHDNDASESSQPSWGKMCTYGYHVNFQGKVVYTTSLRMDDDEVYEMDGSMAYGTSSLGGGFQLEDDFSDGYMAQVYDIPGQLDALCDQFDIHLKIRVDKVVAF
ncbi:hypothetical protein Tco_0804987 [Tanacetum coccineum]